MHVQQINIKILHIICVCVCVCVCVYLHFFSYKCTRCIRKNTNNFLTYNSKVYIPQSFSKYLMLQDRKS